MTTKAAFVQVVVRDPEGNVIATDAANGTTDDEGVTITVPIGYLPNVENAAPGDITVTVIPAATVINPAGYVSSSDDTENLTRTVIFNLEP